MNTRVSGISEFQATPANSVSLLTLVTNLTYPKRLRVVIPCSLLSLPTVNLHYGWPDRISLIWKHSYELRVSYDVESPVVVMLRKTMWKFHRCQKWCCFFACRDFCVAIGYLISDFLVWNCILVLACSGVRMNEALLPFYVTFIESWDCHHLIANLFVSTI